MPGRRSQLILNYPQLDDRVNELFERMRSSRALRESFLHDPAGVTYSALFDGETRRARSKLSSANRLLYCFLADQGMREWANTYTASMVRRFDDLRAVRDPVERKREFMMRVDRNEVAREFASALATVGGPDLQAAVVDSEGTIDPVGPVSAIAGPVAAVPVLVVAFVGLFVAVETEFAVHQHNALWGPEPPPPPPEPEPEPGPGPPPEPEPEPGPPPPPEPEPEPEPGPPPPPEPEPEPGPPPEPEPEPEPEPGPPPPPESEGGFGPDEVANWLGLTRTNLKQVADILAVAMTDSALRLARQGTLARGTDEVQAALDRLSVEGRL